nr:hypothetical protein BOSE7B_41251 [Bosea sp. 7B]
MSNRQADWSGLCAAASSSELLAQGS